MTYTSEFRAFYFQEVLRKWTEELEEGPARCMAWDVCLA